MLVDYKKIGFSKCATNIEKYVFTEIKKQFNESVYTQNEYLNFLYTNKTDKKIVEAKQNLFNNPTVYYLLNQKVEEVESSFEEVLDDRAYILVVKDNFYEIIDIKIRNLSKSAQSPNIISAFKLAQVCAKMIDNKEFDNFSINYFEIEWILENENLVCKDAHFASLFKCNPSSLYINWAEAMQLQFHVCDLDQEFEGSREEWTISYLKHFVTQAKKRSEDMISKFVKPFEKYIN